LTIWLEERLAGHGQQISWPRPADHRCRWPSMLETGLQSS